MSLRKQSNSQVIEKKQFSLWCVSLHLLCRQRIGFRCIQFISLCACCASHWYCLLCLKKNIEFIADVSVFFLAFCLFFRLLYLLLFLCMSCVWNATTFFAMHCGSVESKVAPSICIMLALILPPRFSITFQILDNVHFFIDFAYKAHFYDGKRRYRDLLWLSEDWNA